LDQHTEEQTNHLEEKDFH